MRTRPAILAALLALLALPTVEAAPALAQGASAPAAGGASAAGEAAAPDQPKRSRTRRKSEGDTSVGKSAARGRQKACGAEWRALGDAEKRAQGPKWPQYYSKCVKRLKEQRA